MRIVQWVLLLLLFGCYSCRTIAPTNSPGSEADSKQLLQSQDQSARQDIERTIEIDYTSNDSLNYHDYRVEKHERTVKMAKFEDVGLERYALLKRAGKPVARFNALQYPLGNNIDLGLCACLGNNEKQLVIRQEIPKNILFQIVDLPKDHRVIFDGRHFPVNGEISLVDIDRDGVFELLLTDAQFDYFDILSAAESPRVEVIFKYFPAQRTYLPANYLFSDYLLKGIETELLELNGFTQQQSISEQDNRMILVRLLTMMLKYIYAGKESMAWSLFQQQYKADDKERLAAQIKRLLADSTVYQAIKQQ